MSKKYSSDNIENRIRDPPVCSAVPQPLRHRVPRTHTYIHVSIYQLSQYQQVIQKHKKMLSRLNYRQDSIAVTTKFYLFLVIYKLTISNHMESLKHLLYRLVVPRIQLGTLLRSRYSRETTLMMIAKVIETCW
jgi:hypothetical protein